MGKPDMLRALNHVHAPRVLLRALVLAVSGSRPIRTFATTAVRAAVVGALGLVSQAQAASYQGTIQNVFPLNGAVYVVVTSGSFDGAVSSCSAGGNQAIYRFDPTTPFGRTLMATVMAARLSGKLVYAVGDGQCVGGTPFGGGGWMAEGLLGIDLKG
jgi:hypothetical protein